MVRSANDEPLGPGAQVELLFRQMIPLRDGLHLAANVFLPKERAGGVPAIIEFTPHSRDTGSPEGVRFASEGFSFVSVDCRGRGDSEGDFIDIMLPTIGHAGDGNMYPLLVFDSADQSEVERARNAFADIVELALRLGGTIAAEHGVGTLKRPYLELEIDPTHLAVERRVKALLDPDNLLNPGKAI